MGVPLSFLLVNAIYVVIAVAMAVRAYHLPGQGGLVPLVVGVPTFLLALTSVFRRVRAHRVLREENKEPSENNDVAPWRLASGVVLWLIALLIMVFFLGFYVSIPIFSVAYVRSNSRVGWLASLTLAVALWATVYVSFSVLLQSPLFQGVLFGAILPVL
jgi:hypothetical protein